MAITLQSANSIVQSDGATAEDLALEYGRLMGEVKADFIYRDFLNTNYKNTPTRGGTVKVRRLKKASSQAYGTARTAGEGDALEDHYAKVDVDTDREIAEEMDAKDIELYELNGGLALLESRREAYANELGEELEDAFFTELQSNASDNGLVTLSGETGIEDMLTLLIQNLEDTDNDYTRKVPRKDMVLSLASEWFDKLEKELTTLANPLNGRTDRTFFRSVEVVRAVRQGFDAIVSIKGAIAQPLVLGEFQLGTPQFSADRYTYMPYFYGTEAVMPELIKAGALDDDISA